MAILNKLQYYKTKNNTEELDKNSHKGGLEFKFQSGYFDFSAFSFSWRLFWNE